MLGAQKKRQFSKILFSGYYENQTTNPPPVLNSKELSDATGTASYPYKEGMSLTMSDIPTLQMLQFIQEALQNMQEFEKVIEDESQSKRGPELIEKNWENALRRVGWLPLPPRDTQVTQEEWSALVKKAAIYVLTQDHLLGTRKKDNLDVERARWTQRVYEFCHQCSAGSYVRPHAIQMTYFLASLVSVLRRITSKRGIPFVVEDTLAAWVTFEPQPFFRTTRGQFVALNSRWIVDPHASNGSAQDSHKAEESSQAIDHLKPSIQKELLHSKHLMNGCASESLEESSSMATPESVRSQEYELARVNDNMLVNDVPAGSEPQINVPEAQASCEVKILITRDKVESVAVTGPLNQAEGPCGILNDMRGASTEISSRRITTHRGLMGDNWTEVPEENALELQQQQMEQGKDVYEELPPITEPLSAAARQKAAGPQVNKEQVQRQELHDQFTGVPAERLAQRTPLLVHSEKRKATDMEASIVRAGVTTRAILDLTETPTVLIKKRRRGAKRQAHISSSLLQLPTPELQPRPCFGVPAGFRQAPSLSPTAVLNPDSNASPTPVANPQFAARNRYTHLPLPAAQLEGVGVHATSYVKNTPRGKGLRGVGFVWTDDVTPTHLHPLNKNERRVALELPLSSANMNVHHPLPGNDAIPGPVRNWTAVTTPDWKEFIKLVRHGIIQWGPSLMRNDYYAQPLPHGNSHVSFYIQDERLPVEHSMWYENRCEIVWLPIGLWHRGNYSTFLLEPGSYPIPPTWNHGPEIRDPDEHNWENAQQRPGTSQVNHTGKTIPLSTTASSRPLQTARRGRWRRSSAGHQ